MKPGALALGIASGVCLVRLAHADDAGHRRAAESFRQAQAAFERRDFAAAAAAFEQAATFEPHPAPVLNAADAWERAGEPTRAADDCDRALAMPNITPAYRSDADQCLLRLAPKLAMLDFQGPSTISVRVDDGPQLIVPTRKRVAPGHHAVAVVDLRTSQAHTLEVDLRGGETRALDVAPAPEVTTTPETARPPAPPDRASGGGGVPASTWIAFGIGGAATVTATVFGLFTLSAKSSFDGGDHTQSAADTFHRDQTVTNVAWGVAGVAAAAGVVLWLTAPRGAGPSLAVTPTRSGASLVGTVSFR